jgi:peptidoglycan/LPS O-acetylase OafA/YrhL
MHITHYIDEKFYNNHLVQNNYWGNFIKEGGNGVSLFFVISGFILSVPFAKWRLNKGEPISLRNFYLRRVTRLEPPYIIALIILFVANVWVVNKYSFDFLLPRLLASIFYVHTIIYHQFSLVMPVAWSLEVEVQFYILAPLFCLIFLIRSKSIRWIISSLIIIGSAVYWFDDWTILNVFKCLHYFFMGILLADLYCSKVVLFKDQRLGLLAGISALVGFLFITSIHNSTGYLIKLACMFILIHTSLTNNYIKKLFSNKILVIIGGMCYSIYLLHFAIISFVGSLLLKSGINVSGRSYLIPFFLLFIATVLIISAVYFIAVEKPFMRPIKLILGQPPKKKLASRTAS